MIYNMTEVQSGMASEHCRAVFARCRGLTYCMFDINLLSTIIRHARVVGACVCGQPALLDQKDTRRSCAGVHPTSPTSKRPRTSQYPSPSSRSHASPCFRLLPVSISREHRRLPPPIPVRAPAPGLARKPEGHYGAQSHRCSRDGHQGQYLAFLVQASVPLAGREAVSEVKQYMWQGAGAKGAAKELACV
ncbi:hypothetical protein FIBSPDRAFT_477784 [Athelia psychrophila]|uniref:Uncharacterized protein n=1 Tax=Athelia psychrophila TaxID=1759441 RepID=A0A166V9L6_9AGAM|nr:hypothetical protein FIBSPDRAFT_477784 [Fibularhizoctonia sp. CBS 109695]